MIRRKEEKSSSSRPSPLNFLGEMAEICRKEEKFRYEIDAALAGERGRALRVGVGNHQIGDIDEVVLRAVEAAQVDVFFNPVDLGICPPLPQMPVLPAFGQTGDLDTVFRDP